MNRNNGGFLSNVFGFIFLIILGVFLFSVYNNGIDETGDKVSKMVQSVFNGGKSDESESQNGENGEQKPIEGSYNNNYKESLEVLSQNIVENYPDEVPTFDRKEFLKDNSLNKAGDDNNTDIPTSVYDDCDVRKSLFLAYGKGTQAFDNCTKVRGEWKDYYGKASGDVPEFKPQESYFGNNKDGSGNGYMISKNPTLFDVDFVVPLEIAWKSGAYEKDFNARNKIANDSANLVIADKEVIQSKNSNPINIWAPPKNSDNRCDYAKRYAYTKAKYDLKVTQNEYDTLTKIIKEECK